MVILEGATDGFSVRLSAQPYGDVSVDVGLVVADGVSVAISDNAGAAISQLNFTSANWRDAQTLTITALSDDDIIDGQITLTLTIADASSLIFDLATEAFSLWIEDDDPAALVLAATTTNTTTTTLAVSANLVILEGATTGFTVRLNSQPYADVSVDVALVADNHVSARLIDNAGMVVDQLNFTSDNWHDAQTVIIEALADDDIIDGQLTITLQVADASSLIFGVASDSFELWLEDDDEAGLNVVASGVATIYEGGIRVSGGILSADLATQLFTVVLTSQPLTDTVISLSSETLSGAVGGQFTDLSGAMIDDLTFSSANWATVQSVLFEAIGDTDARDGVVSVIFSVTDATSASWGSGLVSVSSSYRVEVQDDDAATIGILASTTTLVEGGASATLLVRLNANPIDNISLTITTAHDTSASVTLSDLVAVATQTIYFDASNWATGVTLVALASDDADVSDGVVTVSIEVSDSSTANYSNARYGFVQASETVLLTVVDDDEAGILLAEASSTAVAMEEIEAGLTEGGTNALLVRLNAPPSAEVSVVLSLSVETIGLGYEPVSLTLSGDSVQTTAASEQYLLFDASNWNIDQTLELSVLDDLDAYGGTALLLLSIAPSSTPSFAEAMATATVFVLDDELAELSVSANLVIMEGVTDVFTVRLSAQPYADVSVDVALVADNHVSARLIDNAGMVVGQLTFTSANWHDAQTVLIEALADDDIVNGQLTVTLSVADASSLIFGVTGDSFELWLEDDDEAGLNVVASGIAAIYEGGIRVSGGILSADLATQLFTVVLTSQPLTDTVISLSSETLSGAVGGQFTDLSGAMIDDLTFSSANWATVQSVLFEAIGDTDARDGVVSVIFSVTDATSASWGSGLVSVSSSYRVEVQDDDAATIGILASTTTLVEGGASATLLVRLNANPIDNISLTITTAHDTSASVTLSDPTLAVATQTSFILTPATGRQGVTLVASGV